MGMTDLPAGLRFAGESLFSLMADGTVLRRWQVPNYRPPNPEWRDTSGTDFCPRQQCRSGPQGPEEEDAA